MNVRTKPGLLAMFAALFALYMIVALSQVGSQGRGPRGQQDESQRGGQSKVIVCHATGSATNPVVQIEVAEPAVRAHLAHGDELAETDGSCTSVLDKRQGRTDQAQPDDQDQTATATTPDETATATVEDALLSQQGASQQFSQAQTAVPDTEDKDHGRQAKVQQSGQNKVIICHATGSATNPYVQIEVAEPAVQAHEAHGDTVPTSGNCPDVPAVTEGQQDTTQQSSQAQTLALNTPDQSLVPSTPDEGSDRLDEAQQGGQAKVLICHATHSVTNPYVLIEVAEPAVETHRLHGDIVDPAGGVCPEAQVAPDTDQNLQDPAQANDQGQQALVQQSSQNQAVIPNAQDASQSQQGTVQQGSQNQSVPNVQEENKAIFSRFLDEVANQGNIAAVDELFSPDVVAHQELLPGMPAGHEGVKQFFTALRSAFPDLHVTIEDQIAEGDRVVARETWRGTYRGGFQGIPSTGQQVAFTVIDIVRIADGKLVEQWATIDNLSLLQQLGVYSTAVQSGQ